MAEFHNEKLKQINRSGFLFQLRVEHEIQSTHIAHGWKVSSREHAWANPLTNKNGFIDLVVEHHSMSIRLVIECKRIKAEDARQLRWVFLIPDTQLNSTNLSSCFEVEGRIDISNNEPEWSDIQVWDNVNSNPASFESQFCVLPNDEQRRQSILENLAGEVLESVVGFAQEEINIAKSKNHTTFLRRFIFPVIVTNAELVICRFNSHLINIDDGTLDEKDTTFETVPFVRFRKSLATEFPQGVFDDLKTVNQERERTVFIVNASRLSEFLNDWDVKKIGTKFAFERP